eukprot:13130305-Alexandrium_andersonii.AAC.1
MSASLVGSEMCIRDRLRPAWESAPALRRGGGHALRRPAGGRLRLGGRDPVSYTHLTLPTICSV